MLFLILTNTPFAKLAIPGRDDDDLRVVAGAKPLMELEEAAF